MLSGEQRSSEMKKVDCLARSVSIALLNDNQLASDLTHDRQ